METRADQRQAVLPRAAVEAQPDSTALLSEGKARFTAQVPADVPATRGRRPRLAIDPGRLYFFDPATSGALTS